MTDLEREFAESTNIPEHGDLRCKGRYPTPPTSPRRDEPFEVTYRCGLESGHRGMCGPESCAADLSSSLLRSSVAEPPSPEIRHGHALQPLNGYRCPTCDRAFYVEGTEAYLCPMCKGASIWQMVGPFALSAALTQAQPDLLVAEVKASIRSLRASAKRGRFVEMVAVMEDNAKRLEDRLSAAQARDHDKGAAE